MALSDRAVLSVLDNALAMMGTAYWPSGHEPDEAVWPAFNEGCLGSKPDRRLSALTRRYFGAPRMRKIAP